MTLEETKLQLVKVQLCYDAMCLANCADNERNALEGRLFWTAARFGNLAKSLELYQEPEIINETDCV